MPKVSIIIPVYNVEKYLNKCLDSIINQTLNDIEIICINDGSTDKSLSILELFKSRDERIKVISQPNAGLSAARNKGMEAAQGEYICFVDSDDYIDLDFCKKLYSTAVKHDADIACATIIRKREYSEKYRVHYTEEKIYTTLKEKINCCDIPRCCYVWNKLYKKDLVKNHLFKIGTYFEDVLWIPEVLKKANKLVCVPNTSYFYVVRSNSIVKSPSKKKQEDSYNVHKYIIEFFENNKLPLSNKARNLTKKIIYVGRLSVLKIKEFEGKESYWLFGLIPIINLKNLFFYKDFDSHYILRFGKIKLNIRHKARINYIEINSLGTTTEKRNPQIIISLTSHPARINAVHIAISSLLTQDLKADKVILWLAESQFPNREKDLPENLLRLQQFGLSIEWCEDLKSYKKLIPTLKAYPEDIIITTDDDIFYDNQLVADLYNSYLKYPNEIHVRRACNAYIKNNTICCDKFPLERYLKSDELYKKAKFSNQLMSGSGCLFPPHSLFKDVVNSEIFLNTISTHDDIYFWAMAVLNETPIRIVEGFKKQMINIDNTQSTSLAKSNKKNGSGLEPCEAFIRIGDKYPKLIETIEGETKL
jgi:glycosyltransferase involved in cell wall biosynthesis